MCKGTDLRCVLATSWVGDTEISKVLVYLGILCYQQKASLQSSLLYICILPARACTEEGDNRLCQHEKFIESLDLSLNLQVSDSHIVQKVVINLSNL